MKNLFLLFLLSVTIFTYAQKNNSSDRTLHYNLKNGLALQGYDPVSYFVNNKAMKGKSSISTNYHGVTYYFSTKSNKEQFLKSPIKYEPKYGGWCAYAMGDSGEKIEVDPETFKIINGKLFLFYNAYFNNTLKSWNKNEKKLQLKAENNWMLIINK